MRWWPARPVPPAEPVRDRKIAFNFAACAKNLVMSLVQIQPVNRRIKIQMWAVLMVAAWLALVAVNEIIRPPGAPPLCNLRRFTGLPCFTCGTTRAFLALGRGDVPAALRFNPLICVALALLMAWLVMRIGFGRRIVLRLSTAQRRAMWIIIALLVAANWIYLIVVDRG